MTTTSTPRPSTKRTFDTHGLLERQRAAAAIRACMRLCGLPLDAGVLIVAVACHAPIERPDRLRDWFDTLRPADYGLMPAQMGVVAVTVERAVRAQAVAA